MPSIPQLGYCYELYLDMAPVFTYAGAVLPKANVLFRPSIGPMKSKPTYEFKGDLKWQSSRHWY